MISAPTTTMDCIKRAYRVEHRLNQLKETRVKKFESKKKGRELNGKSSGRSKTQRGKWFQRQDNNKRKGNFLKTRNNKLRSTKKVYRTAPACEICVRSHLGECKIGTNICFNYGKEGHFAKKYPTKISTNAELGYNYPQETQLNWNSQGSKNFLIHKITKGP